MDKATEETIFEKSRPGSNPGGYTPAASKDARAILGKDADVLADGPPPLPELGELDVVRHFTHLSKRNFSIDGEFYPLGSCTMKYNPRLNEWAAARDELTGLHPLAPAAAVQGRLRMLYELRTYLEEIAGLNEVSLVPAAGRTAN